jgi:hypothetical protein
MQMSWDTVYSWSQFLAVFFAGVALVSGFVVNKRQAKQLLTLEKDLLEQREKTAVAEKAALDITHFVRQFRTLDTKAMTEILSLGQKGSVELLYVDGSQDSYLLALNLGGVLAANGWKASEPKVMTEETRPKFGPTGPVMGIAIETSCESTPHDITKPLGKNEPFAVWDEPANTLFKAMLASKVDSQMFMTTNRDLPQKFSVRIVIGPKL